MLLAFKGFMPQKEWYHDPTLINNHKSTVAMRLASSGIIPPK